ncbi:MAG: glycerol kinase GlpK [Clostridia bacterium]|nr:glycerol kinase GlpK [Clostridia bacterium]MBQ9802377.1 glycerol kinase GlpK [Clostridia bacterium]
MKQYLMALDQGTTSSRTIIFDADGHVVAKVAREFTQYFPKEGWVEHDAMEIWESQLETAREALRAASLSATDIAAIGITNQRETTVVWDKKTGRPICPAIVWQCRRTASRCATLRETGVDKIIREKTGLAADPYFSATKLQWILQNVPGAKARAMAGELLFGTVDTWLLYQLTGGKLHATDPSNASRTMLFNIHTLMWDEELLQLFDIPCAMLPTVMPTVGVFGSTDAALFGTPIPIGGVAGDQQAALFGQGCFEAGDAKNTYGTGGFLLMNTGKTPTASQNGLLTTVGWQLGGQTTYVLEGSVFICGAAIQWLRDGLGLLTSSAQSEQLAATVPDSGGVYFVPAFVGLGTPYWDADTRGTICGITRGTTRAHLVRATLEAMALQTVDVIDAMRRDTGLTVPLLRVDGGGAANSLLLQMQSDFAALPLARPDCIETTAWGAATMAGLAVGIYSSTQELLARTATAKLFEPAMPEDQRLAHLEKWHRAIESARLFAK